MESRVVSVEINPQLAERARARLTAAGIGCARIETADAIASYEPGREFDAVCVTGAVFDVPEKFKSWLRVGGRLFVIRGESPALEGLLITRLSKDDFRTDSLFESATNTFERNFMLRALEKCGWNVTATAEYLGIPLSTLKYKMDKLDVRQLARRIRGVS